MDPQDAVGQLSLNTLSAMTNSAFGSIAGPVVDEELIDILGIGGSSDLAGYMDKINAALDKIEHQVADLQASITSILAGITEIKEQINDVEVQAKLQVFSDNAGVVKEYFITYQDDIEGLTSPDASRRTAAIKDLYGRLNTDNAVKIATAMTAIQEAFLPSLIEQKGLIEFQKSLLNDQMTGASSADDGFIVLGDQDHPNSPFTNSAGQYGWYSGYGLLGIAQNAATTVLNSSVLDTFRAFVTVSIQGLILLNAAWLNSIHEEQIKAQVDAIRKVLAAMVNFGAAIPAMVDAQAASNLQTYGKRISPNDDGYTWDQDDGRRLPGNPYTQDWIQWYTDYESADAACTPWNYSLVYNSLFWNKQDRVFMVMRPGDGDTTPAPSRYNPGAASGLVAFLAPLKTLSDSPDAKSGTAT